MNKSNVSWSVLCTLALATGFAATGAQANQAMAAKYACVACHQADKNMVGPSWKQIASKYADGSKTAVQLADSIKKGGTGKWPGTGFMPPQPGLPEADAKLLSEWILGQAERKP
jgi:cytochrome c